MLQIKKYDRIHVAALAATVLGLVLELIGSLVLSRTTTIGFNFSELHPLLFVGFAITVAALVVAVIGNTVHEEKAGYVISSAALYCAIAAVLAGTVIIALTIAGPVLWPTNG